ncbi:hypothetical protein ACPA9J_20765 [Pseudomonas aeruginosa]
MREDFEFNLHSAVRVLWAGALIPPCSGASVGASAGQRLRHVGRFPEMWARWYVGDASGHAPCLLPLCMASLTWRPGVTLCRGGREWTTRCSLLVTPGDQLRGFETRACPTPSSRCLRLLERLAAASTSVFGTALIGCLNTCFIARADRPRRVPPESSSSVSASRCCLPADGLEPLIPAAFLVPAGDHVGHAAAASSIRWPSGEARSSAAPWNSLGDRRPAGLVSLEGGCSRSTRRACRMLGYSLGLPWARLLVQVHLCGRPGTGPRPGARLLAGRINSYQMEKRTTCARTAKPSGRASPVSLVRTRRGRSRPVLHAGGPSVVASVPSWSAAPRARQIKLATDAGPSASGGVGPGAQPPALGFPHVFDLYGIHPQRSRETTVERWKASRHAEDPRPRAASWSAPSARLQKFDCGCIVRWPRVRHLRAIATLTRDEDNRPVRMISIQRRLREIRTYQAETLHREEKNARR